jgi:hypothetical protein
MLHGKENLRHTYKNKMSTTEKSILIFFIVSFTNPFKPWAHNCVGQDTKEERHKGEGKEE